MNYLFINKQKMHLMPLEHGQMHVVSTQICGLKLSVFTIASKPAMKWNNVNDRKHLLNANEIYIQKKTPKLL